MSGLWTCRSCELRFGLDTNGQAQAPAGFCAAGQHHVKERIRYAPHGVPRTIVATPMLSPSLIKQRFVDAAGQWEMF